MRYGGSLYRYVLIEARPSRAALDTDRSDWDAAVGVKDNGGGTVPRTDPTTSIRTVHRIKAMKDGMIELEVPPGQARTRLTASAAGP